MFVSAKNTQPQDDLPLHCSFARSDWEILAGFWHPVATSGEVADAPVRVHLLDMPVVLFRTRDGVKAAKDVCMHRGGQLSLGSVCDGLLVCGFHGFEYNGEGTCVGIPALAKGSPIPKKLRLRTFQCRERYGLIWVCLADQARAEMPGWPQIEDGSGTVIRIPSYEIKASAGRRVENFNDIAHVPFLHRNSFGGPPTDIAPYDVISGDNTLSFKVDILEQTRYSGEFGGQLRQYSLLNDERETDRYVIAVLREEAGRGGSRSMHGGVAEGSALRIGAPRNAFPLEESAAPVVLLAGGIGVTPILAMARNLNARGKPFELHFATRSAARTPFLAEVLSGPFKERLRLYHDDNPAMRFDIGRFVDRMVAGTHLYLCGPGGFMAAVSEALAARPDIVLHREYFTAPDSGQDAGEPFTLALAQSGTELVVAAGQSILEVLQAHGIDCATSCEEGICGTCLTRVLAGEIEHRDHFLSAGERASGDRMLICVSRGKANARLVLDL